MNSIESDESKKSAFASKYVPVSPEISKIFALTLSRQNSNGIFDDSFRFESIVLSYVKDGNAAELKNFLRTDSCVLYPGNFTESTPIQLQYQYVSSVALLSRAAMLGGLPENYAYALYDTYILIAPRLKSINEIWKYILMAAFDFTNRVKINNQKSINSYPVAKAISFISAHIFENISLQQVADNSNVTYQYMSQIFKKEVGISFNSYLNDKKMEIAAKLLITTKMSVHSISDALSYRSYSNFCEQFRRKFQMSASSYRVLYKNNIACAEAFERQQKIHQNKGEKC